MSLAEARVRERLFALADPGYKQFQCGLMPTVSPDTVIGVRTPELRRLARELFGTPEAEEYLRALPHRYYEENNLHGLLLERVPDYGRAMAELKAFLPYIDNWATCDLMCPKVFQRHLPELLPEIQAWLAHRHAYTVRFGIETLMRFYLDGAFSPEFPAWVAAVRSDEYYVNMMIAWYFATALAKQWDAVVPYIQQRRLERWTHNKTIQKATESYRVTQEQKALLRALRAK